VRTGEKDIGAGKGGPKLGWKERERPAASGEGNRNKGNQESLRESASSQSVQTMYSLKKEGGKEGKKEKMAVGDPFFTICKGKVTTQ